MKDVTSLILPHIREISPYSSARDEYTGELGVFLDANENPYGTVDGTEWNRYPDPHHRLLREKISKLKGISSSNIFLGNGSDEPIDLLIRLVCKPEYDHILLFPPTYGMYQVAASIQHIGVKKVYLTQDFQLDMPAVRKALLDFPKIVFICSPNNPTGNKLNREEIREVLSLADGLVVIDEAYIDFSGEDSFLSENESYPNLIVLQTFSKAWGMASFRMGMALAHTQLIAYLYKIKPPYNLSGPVQQLALACLDQHEKKNEIVAKIIESRDLLIAALNYLPIVVKVFPSDANFLLVRFQDAQTVFDYLIENKVIVRNRTTQPGCAGCLRITIGTPEENNRLISLLKVFISKK